MKSPWAQRSLGEWRALSAGLLLLCSSGEQVTAGQGSSSSRPHSWPWPPTSSYRLLVALSLPGNPSGAGDVALSETQTDPRSTVVEYLSKLCYTDGSAGDKPGTMCQEEVSGGRTNRRLHYPDGMQPLPS